MKPIRLQFKGINSFSEQTEIDFEKLTKNGIFGIFGDTGSGKSTILDCISFALYGKVERSREKLDIINYKSEAAEVKFEFDVVTEGKRKRFSAERSIKRKSGIHKAVLYEDGACIADNASSVTKKITEILGVDAEDFRKCIALPQGEFSQFVKSQPSERIALIERLFSLSKYGDRLKERLKARESRAELNYQTVSAKLGLFSDISKDTIKETCEQIEIYKRKIEKLSEDVKNAEKDYTSLKLLSEKRSELLSVSKKLCEFEKIKSRMEELRASIKAFPLCKTAVEYNSELKEKKHLLCEISEVITKNEAELNLEKENISKLNLRTQSVNFDEDITNCITLSAKYSALEGKPEKLAVLEKELERKRSEYRVKDERLSKLKSKVEVVGTEVGQIKKRIAEYGVKDIEKLINVDFKGAVLKEEYVNTLDYFSGLNGQIKFFKDGSELYKFIERELKHQIDDYKDKVYQVKDFNLDSVRSKLENLQSSDDEREKLNELLNKKTAELSDAQIAVKECEKDMSVIQREGGELRKRADEIKSELLRVFGKVENFSDAVKENSAALENLRLQKSRLTAEIEKSNKRISELSEFKAGKITEEKAVAKQAEILEEKLKSVLMQSGKADIDSCENLVREFEKFADVEKALAEYDSDTVLLSARRAELEKTEGIKDFTEESLKFAEERKNLVLSELSEAREKLAVLLSELKKAEDRLKEKQLLQQDLNSAEKERNLIARLKDLTKGNKFMEYIANEYLYDISSLASSTLLNLTDGRYFLTYTDTFYAGDNFNCGKLRGVNTLSGGETFLVSLSLALALSQTICASLKSIEFFFLDEGFGTLDGTLVDTVMNALEKLKSSRFTIGVISHVEELKHRIDNKITVYKATENHGSTVQISC